MIYTIEGIDACGKTTVAKAVSKMLGGCRVIHFPDDNAVTGPMIRDYLKARWRVEPINDNGAAFYGGQASALAFQALQITNRMEHMPFLQECSGDPNNHVVLVRYWQSAWVYGQLDGLDPEWLEKVHEGMEAPDVNILLDIDPQEAMRRKAGRGGEDERYEVPVTLANAAHLYRELWDQYESCWWVVDAMQPLHEVVADCANVVRESLLC